MQLTTYSELKAKLQNDYDITDQIWIPETELLGYINEAIDDAETAIHTLHHEDKYFLVTSTFSWVNGTADYVLPTDIYSNKIRLVQYSNGSQIYDILRITRLHEIPFIQSSDDYRYLIVNDSTNGVRARFYPTPAETSSNAIIWYVRNMKRMTTSAASTNVCEIPECVNFVYQHVKKNLAKKTRRTDLIAVEDSDLKVQYSIMLDALKDMTAEENNLVPFDLSSYWDQEGGTW